MELCPVGVRNSDQELDLRLRNAAAQTCQHLSGRHGRKHPAFGCAVGLAAAAMQEFPQPLGTHAEGLLGPSQWEPRLAYVPDFGPGPDEATVRTRPPRASGPRALRPTTRPPRPTPPV